MIDTLREVLPRRARRRLERAGRAAVLVPIVDDGGPLRILLTRRTEEVATHRGQVAFPGGYLEPGEDDPVCAALREAEEEIGLPPQAVEVLGLLDDFTTWNDEIVVTPVAGRVARLPELRPHAAEVARIFTIPVADLGVRDRWVARLEDRPGGPRRLYYFEHDGETLWGLSARIVLHVLDLGSGAPPAGGSGPVVRAF